MIRKSLKHGVALAALAATLATPLPVAGQQQPGGASYPTNTTRPPRRTPAPPPQRTGGLIDTGRPADAPTPPATPVEIATPDVQLANGWITQAQYDQLEGQVQQASTAFDREFRRNASDAARAQRETSDRMLDAIANFGGMSADSTQLLQQMGYTVAPGSSTDNPRQSAEAFMSVIENGIRTEQNVGNLMRPGVQNYIGIIDSAAATNVQMLRETGRMPAETLRAYERASGDVHNRVVARVDRMFYEHDREVDNARRVVAERRTEVVNRMTTAIEETRQRYGNDPRNWPTTPPPPPRPQRFSYVEMLNPRPVTPAPPPLANPRNLPALGGPDRTRPVPEPAIEPIPGPTPGPTPGRRPVRVGEIPPGDPYEGLRVPDPGQVRGTPTPSPRPQPQPRPQRRVPEPVVLQQQTPDVELGLPQDGGTATSPSVMEQIMARIPRNRDGSIDWARVPLAIRAQVILYQHRQNRLGGGSGGSGFGSSGSSSDDPLVRELARRQNEQDRLTAAAQRRTAQDASWNAMVADRFGNSVWDAFGANGGTTLTTLQLEPIYRNYNPLNTIPPAMSLSSAGTSLSAAGWSLSSAGADWRDPAVQSLHAAMGMFDYRARSNPYSSGFDTDRARAAQFAYNAGGFDVQYNRDGRLNQTSGGRLAGSLFTIEDWYLRQLTANGVGGLDALLAQPFNVVLTWGAGAFDLDLHMTGPLSAQTNNRFHIYYAAVGNLTAQPFAALIKDCICNSGSEVILTSALNGGGVYRVSVFNFGNQSATSTNLANASQATIQIVRGGTTQSVGNGTTIVGGRVLLTTTVPSSGAGNTWVAAEINPANGRITVPGAIRQSPNSEGVE